MISWFIPRFYLCARRRQLCGPRREEHTHTQQNNKNNKQQTAIDVAYGSAQHADRERVRETERERKKERKKEHA